MSDSGVRHTGQAKTDHGKTWLGLRPSTLIMLVAIAVLLVPLSMLSQPADSSSTGGKLAPVSYTHLTLPTKRIV